METAKEINLDDILKIPETEFKSQFQNWMESDGIARELQSKLRKDLISNFNKTSLGRKMFSEHAKSQRIMLSPLVLALNTLVAEFLYTTNCHFSLSVFCTEVPFRNILPNFENTEKFRFTIQEVLEILDAITSSLSNEFKDKICKDYLHNSNETPSLLLVILKNCISQASAPKVEIPGITINNTEKDQNSIGSSSQKDQNSVRSANNKRDPLPSLFNTQFRYLNKYLIVLSRKVKEMSQNLEKEKLGYSVQERRTFKTRKFRTLNRSLEKISDNLRALSLTKRKNKTVSAIVQSVDQMAKQFEKCAQNFDFIFQKEKPTTELKDKNYNDWINELQTSKSGRKFIAKIESSLRKTLDREKSKISKAFTEKLEKEKEIIKLKYKQKFLEIVSRFQHNKEESDINKNLNENIDKKLKEFDLRHQELLQKVTEQAANPSELRHTVFLEKTIAPKPPIADLKEISETQNQPNEKFLKKKIVNEISPKLQEMAKTIAQQERNIDHIVFNAKLRIQELEQESTQLDRTFQDYLRRQKSDKSENEGDITKIWESYKRDKEILQKKCSEFRNNSLKKHKKDLTSKETKLESVLREIPQINVDYVENLNLNQPPVAELKFEFENPFRELQKSFVIKKDVQQERIPENNENSNQILERIENAIERNQLLRKSVKSPTVEKYFLRENFQTRETQLSPIRNYLNSTGEFFNSNMYSDFNLKNNTTLEDIEISSLTSSSNAPPAAISYLKVFKSKRKLFANSARIEKDTSDKSSINSSESIKIRSKKHGSRLKVGGVKSIEKSENLPGKNDENIKVREGIEENAKQPVEENGLNSEEQQEKIGTNFKKQSKEILEEAREQAGGVRKNKSRNIVFSDENGQSLKAKEMNEARGIEKNVAVAESVNAKEKSEVARENYLNNKELKLSIGRIHEPEQEDTLGKRTNSNDVDRGGNEHDPQINKDNVAKVKASFNKNNSTSSNESGLSQFIIDSQRKAKSISKNSDLSPSGSKLNDNIFQIGSYSKDEEVSRILESSDSGEAAKLKISSKRSSKTATSCRRSSQQDGKLEVPIWSSLHDLSSSSNSKISLNISVGSDKNENSLDNDFWE